MKSPKALVAIGFLAGFGAGVFVWQQFVTARFAAENQQLREEVKMVAVLTDENARLTSERIDPAELKRLRDGQADLLRLRGQAGPPRREAQEAKAAAVRAAQQAAAQPSPTNLATNDSPVETFTANVTAKVGWQQALVTGGWRTPSGKRAFVFFQPADAGEGAVTVRAHIVEVPENLLASLGLDGIKPDGSADQGSGILAAEQVRQILRKIEKTEGAELVASPQVGVLSGNQAQVSVTQSHTSPSGQAYTTGPVIGVTATVSADKQTVELIISAEVNLPRAQTP